MAMSVATLKGQTQIYVGLKGEIATCHSFEPIPNQDAYICKVCGWSLSEIVILQAKNIEDILNSTSCSSPKVEPDWWASHLNSKFLNGLEEAFKDYQISYERKKSGYVDTSPHILVNRDELTLKCSICHRTIDTYTYRTTDPEYFKECPCAPLPL
jgi:hypothetical protein